MYILYIKILLSAYPYLARVSVVAFLFTILYTMRLPTMYIVNILDTYSLNNLKINLHCTDIKPIIFLK